jgi:hypothetical protein
MTKRSVLMLALLAPLGACFEDTTPTPTPAPGASTSWQIRFSPGMPAQPTAVAGGGWKFSFPLADLSSQTQIGGQPSAGGIANKHVDYVTMPRSSPVTGSSISVTYRIEGNAPVFGFKTAANNTCGGDANFSLLLQRSDDDALTEPFYRWWGHPNAAVVVGSEMTLTVPLSPGSWSSVFGASGTGSRRIRRYAEQHRQRRHVVRGRLLRRPWCLRVQRDRDVLSGPVRDQSMTEFYPGQT